MAFNFLSIQKDFPKGSEFDQNVVFPFHRISTRFAMFVAIVFNPIDFILSDALFVFLVPFFGCSKLCFGCGHCSGFYILYLYFYIAFIKIYIPK